MNAATETHNCDPEASCSNSPFPYSCSCNTGYTGNGFSCIGRFYLLCAALDTSTFFQVKNLSLQKMEILKHFASCNLQYKIHRH